MHFHLQSCKEREAVRIRFTWKDQPWSIVHTYVLQICSNLENALIVFILLTRLMIWRGVYKGGIEATLPLGIS